MSYENYTPSVPQVNGTPILIMGILSLVFSGIVGLILSIIGKKKAAEITGQGIELQGTAKVGTVLCKIGFWLSLVALVVQVLSAVFGFMGGFLGAMGTMVGY